MLKKSASILKG